MKYTMDYSKLKGRIIEKYDTIGEFAEALGTSIQMVSMKLNGRVKISRDDVIEWRGLLDISLKDVGSYFFTVQV